MGKRDFGWRCWCSAKQGKCVPGTKQPPQPLCTEQSWLQGKDIWKLGPGVGFVLDNADAKATREAVQIGSLFAVVAFPASHRFPLN